ncbi:Hypothetical protein NTJ_02491 [Nesidiocoris tenuis]|uniref:Uncharacterized protein n=1 Tax=Nesidiocoris tenuis TaxID=355587 RepID=A0ABN7AES0_9HEMI|nr:Hypothetical protein NTJ_02491 [Nesidiocoris tenuis]
MTGGIERVTVKTKSLSEALIWIQFPGRSGTVQRAAPRILPAKRERREGARGPLLFQLTGSSRFRQWWKMEEQANESDRGKRRDGAREKRSE